MAYERAIARNRREPSPTSVADTIPEQPRRFLTPKPPVQRSRYAYAANDLLSTIKFTAANIKEWAILDSGATSHFLIVEAPTRQRDVASDPLIVRLPDGARVKSTHTCELNLSQLPSGARIGHIIPGLASHSLLSVVKLCNAGCKVTFTKINCTVTYCGKTVLRGHKCHSSGLWMVNLNGNENAGPFKNANSVETALNAAALQLEATLSGNGKDEAQTVGPGQNQFFDPAPVQNHFVNQTPYLPPYLLNDTEFHH